jgi:hypothetical protein
MAMSFDALLRIKADVQGEGAVQGLASKLGGLQGAASKASTGFRGLAGSVGGLVPGLQSLIPLATGAGLTAMATSAINAADNLNDMRQKTGVSVERLSQLQQAAEKSGTTIEGVSAALVKYNRGIVDGKADEALKSLGISATDASGKMKSADQVLLEVADKFATMPDGAEKTAAAIKLFGRAGADMIPMLNGGSESIKGLAVTMTGEFASAADEFNDKMVDLRTGLAKIGVSLGTALMPFLIATTDAVTGMVSAFSNLPGPLQTTIVAVAALGLALVVLAPAIASIVSIAGALAGLQIGATIAGWAAVAAPAITAISAAFTGFLAFLAGTAGPALLAFFSGPVGWTVLAVAAVVAMAIAFREPIMEFLMWLPGAFQEGLNTAWQIIKNVFTSIGEGFGLYVVNPIRSTWAAMVEFLPKAMASVANTVKGVWANIINGIRSAFNGFLQGIANGVNSVANQINRLINSYNNLARNVGGPQVPFVPQLNIPQFATGGFVTRPTMAVIGEGGEPEYVVPQSKAMSFANNIVAGRTGEQALKARQTWTDQMQIGHLAPKGGFTSNLERLAALRQQGVRATFSPMTGVVVSRREGQRTSGSGSVAFSNPMRDAMSATTSPAPPVNISVQTGPVMEFNGQKFVSYDDLERAMRATADGVIGRLRTPAARQALGR